MVYRLGELFSGPGGIGVGASQIHVTDAAGETYAIEHAWATDYDQPACATFRRNLMPDRPEQVLCADITTLDMAKLPAVDAITFGFPCNDFSMAGPRTGLDGHYGGLYHYGVKALHTFRPLWFLAENVSGLRSANEGKAFKKILSDLRAEGYLLTVHEYRFEDYGVPQKRHRVIIVGIREDLGKKFRVPAPTTKSRPVTVAEALAGVEEVPWNNERTRHDAKVVEMLSHIPPGKNAWCDEVPERLRLHQKGAMRSQTYRRLDPNKPAYTLTGSGGGGSHVYHWDEPRALTNRERARLQTFPDDFVFEGSKEQVRKQIGMAVPPHGVQAVFEAILKTMAGIAYPSIEANIADDADGLFSQVG